MIKFYSARDAYGEFSNFYVRAVEIDGKTWMTTEHFFQAMKTLDADEQEAVRALDTPAKAKGYGNKLALRSDWEDVVGTDALHNLFRDDQGVIVERVKDHFMYTALIAKFTQHKDLGALLLNTGDQAIVEEALRDPYWGSGPEGDGLNKLGRMLVLLRTNMRRLLSAGDKSA